MMSTALIYKLATFPFGVVVMSIRWEAVKQIICIHIFLRAMCWKICNFDAFMNITQSVVVDKYHEYIQNLDMCMFEYYKCSCILEKNISEYILDL